nr:MAG TPA: hypothetical protein [Caudoviricetes sp.]
MAIPGCLIHRNHPLYYITRRAAGTYERKYRYEM